MTGIGATRAEFFDTLRAACRRAGMDPAGAEPLRLGENAIYRLPGGVVARITRPGRLAAATTEINMARWLEAAGVPAVQAVPVPAQPVEVDGRAVTFWRELPPHHHGTPCQVAATLRRLHGLDRPTEFELSLLAPFVRLTERIDAAHSLSEGDRAWLREQLAALRRRYARLPTGLPHCVVHGDAWVGNIVSTHDGTVMLDLERCSVGPPEWDLVSTAIKHTSFGWLSAEQYTEFVRTYGHDVTTWDGFATLRDIRELRMTCMAAQTAGEDPQLHEQAEHRVACLRGEYGPRPWAGWEALP